jgi:hypothetical protein
MAIEAHVRVVLPHELVALKHKAVCALDDVDHRLGRGGGRSRVGADAERAARGAGEAAQQERAWRRAGGGGGSACVRGAAMGAAPARRPLRGRPAAPAL